MVNGSFAAQPPSSEPGHRHMDSEKTKQHDNHVQRDDGHEQDDENPQNGRDERQEHSCAVEQRAEERPTTAPIMCAIDLGSRSEACESVSRREYANSARRLAREFPARRGAASTEPTYGRRVKGRLTASPAVLSLRAELCGARRCLNQTPDIAGPAD
jgi:hypothetical protein